MNGVNIIQEILEAADNTSLECWSGDWSHDWSGDWPHEAWSNDSWHNSH